MVDEHKFCFIICTNDELQLEECILYLNLLHVPEGYQTELITIKDAPSMTSGYNEGMRATDAKYKIYLHQDSFIVEPFFLDKLLELFQTDKSIGMAGTLGTEHLSQDGVMWHEDRCGNVYLLSQHGGSCIKQFTQGYREVEALDGLLIATQYDLPWREDLFQGWHFYDVSQCMEFRRAGYKIVVPRQEKNWVIHSCGICSLWNYDDSRRLLLQTYPEIVEQSNGRKRILFLRSRQVQLSGISYTLAELGHKVKISLYDVDMEDREEDQENVEELLDEGHYDLVVTYAFNPAVSNACQSRKVPYYAWIYDSPLMSLYSREALNEMNYISVFDRKQYARLKALGLRHLYYLPLASEVDSFGALVIEEGDIEKYSCAVSFVGRLYNNQGFEEMFTKEENAYRKEAEEIIQTLDCVWDDKTSIYDHASEELINCMASKLPEEIWERWSIDKRYFCESFRLARKCNELERIRILSHLQKRFPVVLYSDEAAKEVLNEVEIRPWLDYNQEMPKVFHLSKINLNITSRSIESGIPQRIWDILTVGGFCLTNYQPELKEYFEIGKDLEVYHNLQELEEKIQYYLTHEEKRIRIAINGYKKVRQKHSLQIRLTEMLQHVFEE